MKLRQWFGPNWPWLLLAALCLVCGVALMLLGLVKLGAGLGILGNLLSMAAITRRWTRSG